MKATPSSRVCKTDDELIRDTLELALEVTKLRAATLGRDFGLAEDEQQQKAIEKLLEKSYPSRVEVPHVDDTMSPSPRRQKAEKILNRLHRRSSTNELQREATTCRSVAMGSRHKAEAMRHRAVDHLEKWLETHGHMSRKRRASRP